MLAIVGTFVVFIITLCLALNWQSHRFWSSRGVPTPPYLPFFGNTLEYFGQRWSNMDKMYHKFKSVGYWGIYEGFDPNLFLSDISLIKDIAIKDFDHFVDRKPFALSSEGSYINEMLFMGTGDKWKALRNVMTPLFTSGKMKGMFSLIAEKGDDLVTECEKLMKEYSFLNMHSIAGYFNLDAIAICTFGLDAKCIQTKEDSDFVKNVRAVLSVDVVGGLKYALSLIWPKLYMTLEINEDSKYEMLSQIVDKALQIREKTGEKRGDFLDLLLDMKKNAEGSKYPITLKTLKAQAFLFILTGFHTTGGSLALTMYLLAKNAMCQKRLRDELQTIIASNGGLNYQNLMEAPYLDACISESLRMYPSAVYIDRKCTKPYVLENKGLNIPEGLTVTIPLWSLHYDSDYWPNPTEFNPDRFLQENRQNIKPYTFLPFGLGPRNCIGMRFAQLIIKIGVAKLISNFEVTLKPGFTDVTLKTYFDSFIPDENGIPLVLKKLL